METGTTTRRNFLKNMGCFSLGFSIMGSGCWAATEETIKKFNPPDESEINAWLQVLENGKVKVLTGKLELGQGIRTAIMQVAAEELNTDMELVGINMAETEVTPDEGYTAGSRSIETSAMSVRQAAACARESLIKIAADKMKIKPARLILENGKVRGGGKSITLYELLEGKQLTGRLSQPKEYYAKTKRRLVGKPVARRDILSMVSGKPVYVHDLRFPGMVHARVVRPSSYSSKLASINIEGLKKEKELLKLVRAGSFVGVIAASEYGAIQLKNKAKKLTEWTDEGQLPAGRPLKEYIESLPTDTETDGSQGDWESAIAKSGLQHAASYFKPYIMHAANGPSCAVAFYKEEKLTVWTHSQGVYPLRQSLSGMLGIDEAAIHVKGVPGPGCYGHNGADDVAAEAALMAVNYPGKHVRLQWMRDDEHGWEPYGTAMAMKLKAGLSTQGRIVGWKYDVWSDGHSTRPGGNPGSLLPSRFLDKGFGKPGAGFRGGAVRNSAPYYEVGAYNLQSHIFDGPLRKSALRGLGAYANIFAIESFMDELADNANIDPVTFRLNHMKNEREKECLTKLRNNTQHMELKPGEGLGYAFSRYKNSASYCAIASHVQVNRKTGKVKVKKMWAVIDAGEAINPDGLKNQTEGGMIQSASWALMEEVKFNAKHITSLDWETYPILRFNDAPEVEVEVIDRIDEPPVGAGEAAQGPATASIVNAVFQATGVRARELPIRQELLIN